MLQQKKSPPNDNAEGKPNRRSTGVSSSNSALEYGSKARSASDLLTTRNKVAIFFALIAVLFMGASPFVPLTPSERKDWSYFAFGVLIFSAAIFDTNGDAMGRAMDLLAQVAARQIPIAPITVEAHPTVVQTPNISHEPHSDDCGSGESNVTYQQPTVNVNVSNEAFDIAEEETELKPQMPPQDYPGEQ